MARLFGLGKGGGQGIGLRRRAVCSQPLLRQSCADGGLVGSAYGFGEVAALFAQCSHGCGGGPAVGGSQVLGDLSGGVGLLGVTAGGVPAGGGEGWPLAEALPAAVTVARRWGGCRPGPRRRRTSAPRGARHVWARVAPGRRVAMTLRVGKVTLTHPSVRRSDPRMTAGVRVSQTADPGLGPADEDRADLALQE